MTDEESAADPPSASRPDRIFELFTAVHRQIPAGSAGMSLAIIYTLTQLGKQTVRSSAHLQIALVVAACVLPIALAGFLMPTPITRRERNVFAVLFVVIGVVPMLALGELLWYFSWWIAMTFALFLLAAMVAIDKASDEQPKAEPPPLADVEATSK